MADVSKNKRGFKNKANSKDRSKTTKGSYLSQRTSSVSKRKAGNAGKNKGKIVRNKKRETRRDEKEDLAKVLISGVEASLQLLIKKHLIKKTAGQVTIINMQHNDDGLVVTVLNTKQATRLLELDNTTYLGKVLKISSLSGDLTDSKKKIQNIIENFIQSRISPDSKALNLQLLNSDPVLKELEVDKIINTKESKIVKAIFTVASRRYPELETIDLSNNELKSLAPVASIAQYFSKLLNLSFQNNPISSLKELDYFSVTGSTTSLASLRELILTDTDARNIELSKPNGEMSYVREVSVRFPTLQMLDMVILPPEIRAAAEEESKKIILASKLKNKASNDKNFADSLAFSNSNKSTAWNELIPVNPCFTDSTETKDLALGFMSGFFSFYDNSRESLKIVYDENATFSINFNAFNPPSSQSGKNKSPASSKTHLDHSRNLSVLKNHKKRSSLLFRTPHHIVNKILTLPPTAHITSNFIYDSWSIPLPADGSVVNVVMLVVHGNFVETDTSSTYSFDRTFILSQAPPNSPALANGWPCVITEDLLTIRLDNGVESLKPSVKSAAGAPVVPTYAAPAPPVAQAAPTIVNPNYTTEQNQLIITLTRMSGLNYEWSAKCLMETSWDLNKAFEAFNILKNSIPAEAFIQQ